jgi:molecular chaperone DnaK
MVAAAEKALKDGGDKVPAEVKTKVEEKISAVKEVLKKEDATKEEFDTVTKELSETLQQIGQAMYQKEEAKPGETKKEEKKDEKPSEEKVEEGEVVN